MPSARAEEFRRAAARLGFERQRQTGSHERWTHVDGRAVTIPIQGGRAVGRRHFAYFVIGAIERVLVIRISRSASMKHTR
ncbi:MAG: type II toxin-antitoxin system HicA family toxin [Bryobacteraceae bacterium]